jgi:hypothetical protein
MAQHTPMYHYAKVVCSQTEQNIGRMLEEIIYLNDNIFNSRTISIALDFDRKAVYFPIIKSKPAIFNLCSAAHWCNAKGQQVCNGGFRKGPKEEKKN